MTAKLSVDDSKYGGRVHTALSAAITNMLVNRLGLWRGEADRLAFEVEDTYKRELSEGGSRAP